MIRVLVVEDEPPILRGISAMVAAANPSFSVVAQALDGEEAVKALQRVPVDVVITDINMPVLNGIELMRHIHARHPDVLTVVLSGYKEFEYVKSALQFGAVDYLLKPVKEDQMASLLNRLKQMLEERNEERTRKALNDLLFFRRQAAQAKLPPLLNRPLYLLIACAGSLPLRHTPESLLPGEEYWSAHPLSKSIRPLFAHPNPLWSVPGKTQAESIAICLPAEGLEFDGVSRALFEALNRQNLPVSLAVSPPLSAWSALPETMRALRGRMYRELRFARPLLLDPNHPASPDQMFLPQDMESRMLLPMQHRDFELFRKVMTSIFSEMRRSDLTQANVEYILTRMLLSLQKEFSSARDIQPIIGEMVANTFRYDALLEELLAVSQEDFLSEDGGSADKQALVEDIAKFLEEHLSQSVGNQMLSARFGLVPSYISRIFKAHMGVTPLEFVLNRRIAMAKELLLASPAMMSKDISLAVGYPDALYFSRVFKRETGMSPSQFRAAAQQGDDAPAGLT